MPTNPIDLRTDFCILNFSMWFLILKTIVASIAIMVDSIAKGTLIAKNTPLHRTIAVTGSNKCLRWRQSPPIWYSSSWNAPYYSHLLIGWNKHFLLFHVTHCIVSISLTANVCATITQHSSSWLSQAPMGYPHMGVLKIWTKRRLQNTNKKSMIFFKLLSAPTHPHPPTKTSYEIIHCSLP